MISLIDQTGHTVSLPALPKRIISLVPSQTELLHDLGLGDRVVGITKFCVQPETWFRSKLRVGGTKKVSLRKVEFLQPDLIIGNKEENTRSDIEALRERWPVWCSDVLGLPDAIEMIQSVGKLTGSEDAAGKITADITSGFNKLSPGPECRAVYLIWRKPWMVAAGHTFINDMLQRAGFRNVFGQLQRYPEVNGEAIRAMDPEVVLLSSEPYPFREKHLAELQAICPNAQIILTDGTMWSWYGSRLREAPLYLQNLIDRLNQEG